MNHGDKPAKRWWQRLRADAAAQAEEDRQDEKKAETDIRQRGAYDEPVRIRKVDDGRFEIEVGIDGLIAAIDLEDVIRWAVKNQFELVRKVLHDEGSRSFLA